MREATPCQSDYVESIVARMPRPRSPPMRACTVGRLRQLNLDGMIALIAARRFGHSRNDADGAALNLGR